MQTLITFCNKDKRCFSLFWAHLFDIKLIHISWWRVFSFMVILWERKHLEQIEVIRKSHPKISCFIYIYLSIWVKILELTMIWKIYKDFRKNNLLDKYTKDWLWRFSGDSERLSKILVLFVQRIFYYKIQRIFLVLFYKGIETQFHFKSIY